MIVALLALKVPPAHHVNSALNDSSNQASTLDYDDDGDDVVEAD